MPASVRAASSRTGSRWSRRTPLSPGRTPRRAGPLYGIPFAVKDNIDVAGLPTTCACPEFAYVAERTATVVERLQQEGAILIGKTNLDQFATGLNGTRSPYGIPASTFDADYISGGSSSGSAVAVAAGLVSFALGTDTAGSGRVPAAFNNIVGLKPTKGLISATGVVPACKTQDAVSILALTVADAAKVAATAIAFDADDPYARSDAPPFAVEAAPEPLRVGIPNGPIPFFGDDDYEALYHAAIDRMRRSAPRSSPSTTDPSRRRRRCSTQGPGSPNASRLSATSPSEIPMRSTRPFAASCLAPVPRPRSRPSRPSTILPSTSPRRGANGPRSMFCCCRPPAPPSRSPRCSPIPIALNTRLGAYTNFVNLMDLAALAVPAGFRPDGIPFGVTLIGPALSDGMLASIGDALHRSLANARLGATKVALSSTLPGAPGARTGETVSIAVVGAHLTGQPLNGQLVERKAKFVEATRTAPGYSLYALAGTSPPKPGLLFDGAGTAASRSKSGTWTPRPSAPSSP